MRVANYFDWILTQVGEADRRLAYLRFGFLWVYSPVIANLFPKADFWTDRERLITMVHVYSLPVESDGLDI
jgi:hypothetical protein